MSGGEGRFGPGRLALVVGLVAIGFLSLRTAVDFDYGWHLANGRHLLDGVLFGGIDVYSWTAARSGRHVMLFGVAAAPLPGLLAVQGGGLLGLRREPPGGSG